MIAKLNGTADELYLDKLIVVTSGVGYLVYTTTQTLANVRLGQTITLYTHHAIRETAMDLYGFLDRETLSFFELLLSISGIGPKSALGILNAAPIETLRSGIQSGDASHLTKVSGIGKKSAEKIILELRDKLGSIDTGGDNLLGSGDAIEALTALGYSLPDARAVIQKMDPNASTEDMVKRALKQLGS